MRKLKKYEIEFVEYSGLSMQAGGLPMIAGRIFGILILLKDSVSFSELTEVLQVSRGSVSTNTRLLEGLGVLERVSLLGHRQDHFRLPEDPYTQLLNMYMMRSIQYHEVVGKAAAKAPKGSFSRKRLEHHQDFYALTITNMEVLIDKMKEFRKAP